MAHQVTGNGFAVDPELHRLERLLGDLATEWRGAEGQPEREIEIVRQYQVTMERLFELGWDVSVAELNYYVRLL